jgi:N4-(beta-N-acetylglucosaminyl)-L-asparaginase
MSDRRKFVKLSLLSSLAVLTGRTTYGQSARASYKTKTGKPIVISTWGFGKEANAAAWEILKKDGKAIDAVEAGVRVPEADPNNQSVGLGGRPDRDGKVTLDACIMDEHGKCGAVLCLEHIVHAISVARLVKDRTPHVMLAGDGALQFALNNGFKKENLLTEKSEREWKEWLKESKYTPQINIENRLPGGAKNHDTIGMVAMDAAGDLSGACTTSGIAYKMHGRVGDSPIIGAGLCVDNEVGAATCTGLGEAVVRVVAAHVITEQMRAGVHPEAACREAIERIAKNNPTTAKTFQVGCLAMNKNGEYGAFSLQEGFIYAVKSGTEERIYESGHLF